MTLNRDQLLDDLDALTEEQIEAGLAADVWGEAVRTLVQHYVLKSVTALACESMTPPRGKKGGSRTTQA